MPSLLTRSKSLRLLKGGRRGAHQEEPQTPNCIPRPDAFQTDFDRFKAATPVPRSERLLEAPEMLARPSTSGGSGERAIQFHKKTLPAPSVYSEDRFLAFSSPTNSTAVLHAVDSPEDVIGIALGSPTVGSHWTSTPQATTENLIADAQMSAWNHANASTTTVTGPQAQPKPKLSRWKSLFKKTAPSPKEKHAFYQLAQQVAPARADSHHDTSPKSRPKPRPKQEGTVAVPISVFNPDIRASRNKSQENVSSREVQHGRKRSATLDAGRAAPRYRFQRAATTPNPPQAPPASTPPPSTETGAGAGLLGVDIPDVKMDRYSVMFSGVLEPTPSRSSLYQRRQEKAEGDKAKPLDKISIKDDSEILPEPKIQPRDTSPTVSNPPSARLSLFPATGRATPTLRAGTPTLRAGTPVLRAPSPLVSNSPRARAKTAPARSPTHQTFKAAEESKRKPPSTSVTRQYSESPNLKPQQSGLTPTSMNSFESDDESITVDVGRTTPAETKAWKAHVESQEPQWEIVPKPTASSTSSSTSISSATSTIRSTSRDRSKRNATLERSLSRKQPRVTASSALSSHPAAPLEVSSPLQNLQMLLSPPLSANSNEQSPAQRPMIQRSTSQRKPKVMGSGSAQTATVGIARSVSVSKATRPRTLIRTQTDLGKANASTERLDNPERRFGLGDPLALTPMLVEIGNRKSQRVQLVDA
ncbi:hypothetical protein EKO04_005107 [Ascochyta lentis]|uniref:Uncharacterized protein n=1 Tax=Ascochyta lentis TaxID=205686 RepID=A0A8H7J7H6_9PLEO|nr:hypothetical protein EKO04_005107 [Ascochyta lentis]